MPPCRNPADQERCRAINGQAIDRDGGSKRRALDEEDRVIGVSGTCRKEGDYQGRNYNHTPILTPSSTSGKGWETTGELVFNVMLLLACPLPLEITSA